MIEYKSNLKEIISRFDKLDGETKVAIKQGLNLGMLRFMGRMQQQQLSGRRGNLFGLNVISGAGRGSWHVSQLRDSGDMYGVQLNTRSKYMRIHQFGGWIRPKNKPFLAFKPTLGIRTMSRKGVPLKKAKREYGEWVFTKKPVHIPKRLYILEMFQRDGMQTFRRSIFQQLGRLNKMRSMQGISPDTAL